MVQNMFLSQERCRIFSFVLLFTLASIFSSVKWCLVCDVQVNLIKLENQVMLRIFSAVLSLLFVQSIIPNSVDKARIFTFFVFLKKTNKCRESAGTDCYHTHHITTIAADNCGFLLKIVHSPPHHTNRKPVPWWWQQRRKIVRDWLRNAATHGARSQGGRAEWRLCPLQYSVITTIFHSLRAEQFCHINFIDPRTLNAP